jgi:hypothetical protein
VRERNQIVRGLLRLGFGRWTAFQKVIGLCLPCVQIARAAIATLKLLLAVARGSDQYLGFLQSTLDEAADDPAFGDESVFRTDQFRALITKNAMPWIKEIDLMSRFQFSFESTKSIPLIRLGGPAFTDAWKEEHDTALCHASWRFGLGIYDHMSEACDSHQLQPLLGVLGSIEESRIADRARKVCKFVGSIPMANETIINTLSSRDVEGWPKEDQEKIIAHLLQFGVDVDESDEPDYLSLLERCRLKDPDHYEARAFVEGLLSECRQFGGNSQLPAGVASHLTERVATIATLRSLLKQPPDELRKWFGEIRWRGVPKSWQPQHELSFFLELFQRGFDQAQKILAEEPLSALFEAEPPSILTQPEELIRRIRKIDARIHRPAPRARKAAPPKPKRDAPTPAKRATPGWDDIWNEGDVQYPVQISSTSFLLDVGQIVTDRPGFHAQRYIAPAGDTTTREQ